MKLELGKIYIKDIQFGDKTEVKNSVLFVNKAELEELAAWAEGTKKKNDSN